ncbi:TIGR00282 family metallophosphoesterase [Planctomycetota bacterium]
MDLRVLFLGDVVGPPGVTILHDRLGEIREQLEIDLVVANVENAANGSGITKSIGAKLKKAGVDLMTLGDHAYGKRDAIGYVASERQLVRPLNYPERAAGRGICYLDLPCGRTVGLLQLQGRVFLPPTECPFLAADRALEAARAKTKLLLCDIHAEATSEKIALAAYLDGRLSALIGTHTHVQTADEQILPKGTAYITDVGMTGPYDSVLGRMVGPVIQKFTTNVPAFFSVATDDVRISGALIVIDDGTGCATSIRRFHLTADAPAVEGLL